MLIFKYVDSKRYMLYGYLCVDALSKCNKCYVFLRNKIRTYTHTHTHVRIHAHTERERERERDL